MAALQEIHQDVLPLVARRVVHSGATGVVAMAIWQAGRDHRAPMHRGILWSAYCFRAMPTTHGWLDTPRAEAIRSRR